MYAGQFVESAPPSRSAAAPPIPTRAGCSSSFPQPARTAPRSSPGSRARRRTCAACRPAARSRRAAAFATDACARGRHAPPPASATASARPPDRVPVRARRRSTRPPAAVGRAGVASRSRDAPIAGGEPPSVEPPATDRGPLVLEARRPRKDYRLGRGARERHLGGPRRLVRAPPRRGGRAGRRERLGQVDGGAAAGRPGAAAPPAQILLDGDDDRSRRRARDVPRLQERRADGLPGPVRLAEPAAHGALPPRARAARCTRRAPGARRARPSVERLLEQVRLSPAAARSATRTRTSSRAGSASASRSRGRSRRDRGCCSPTSRSRCSTSRSGSRCST